ncbi:hypothetical protein ACQ4M4_20830 [Leptolyngbya sp. AN02str]|uniref:hypothetical protein n=1 Tax=Leptolyngbya sp. AN02str TaxID=3423363 RepID=UPI003D3220F9
MLHFPFATTQKFALIAVSVAGLTLAGCEQTTTDQYQASARTTYTWLVEYQGRGGGASERPPRVEEFASTSLENRNGQRPDGAVTGPDDQGLWWPELPPRPTVDELEARTQPQDDVGSPQLNKRVDYEVTFRLPGEDNRTLDTSYDVYRQVVKAYERRIPLEFTVDPTGSRVTKAAARVE